MVHIINSQHTRGSSHVSDRKNIFEIDPVFLDVKEENLHYQSIVVELSIECFPNTQLQTPNVTALDFFFWGRTKNLVNIDKIPRYEFQPPKTKDDHFCGCPRHVERSITPIGCVPCYKRRTHWHVLSYSNLDNTTFKNKIADLMKQFNV